jgi:hypothetical protein
MNQNLLQAILAMDASSAGLNRPFVHIGDAA